MAVLENFLNRIQVLIDTNFKKHKTGQFYADQLCMSLKQLNRLTKHRRGKTIAQLIDERIHKEAIHLLLDTDLPMKNIAYELQYCDPPYFNRAFKRTEGMTAVTYRRIHEN